MATNMARTPLNDFADRYHDLQRQRNTMDELYRELLLYCHNVMMQFDEQHKLLEDARLDRDAATEARRELQHKVALFTSEQDRLIREVNSLKNRNPYIMVLIDGDGLIFQDQWIRQGEKGGKDAAYKLRETIAQNFSGDIEGIEVVAKVVANLSGLSKAMQRESGLEQSMRDFALGFTQAKASFDFVDVGYGKERADSKIKELTRWNLRNLNCKHIVLGISHDSGYAPFLDDILLDAETRQRVSVLEGVPTVREIVTSQVNIFNAGDDLFRKDKISERHVSPPNSHSNLVIPVKTTAAPQKPPSPPENLLKPTSPASTSSVPLATPTASYAGIAKSASPPPQVTLPLPLRQRAPQYQGRTMSSVYEWMPPDKPDWNPGPRGLDEQIRINRSVYDAVRRRKDNDKLCNNHFLRGPCVKDACPFVHNYAASDDELNAIAVLARQNPCTVGQYCDVDDCIYGHNCPSVRDGKCTHFNCRFGEEAHPPGTKLKAASIRFS